MLPKRGRWFNLKSNIINLKLTHELRKFNTNSFTSLG